MKDKRLAELAGRKVKCPKCGRSKLLPNVPRKPTPEETHPEKAVAPLFQPKKKSRSTKAVSYSILAAMAVTTLLAPVAVVVLTAISYSASLDGLMPLAEGYVDIETGQIADTDFIMGSSVIVSLVVTAIGYVFTIGFLFALWFAIRFAMKPEKT